MSDEIEVEVADVPAAVYDDGETEVFVEDTGAVGGDGDTAKLIEEMRVRQAELQAKVDPVEAMKEAVKGLGASLAPPKEKPDVTVKANLGVTDWKAYEEQFNQKVFESPFQAITEVIGKATEMQAASTANANLAYSKRIVQLDPDSRPYMQKWGDEIEAEVAKMPVAVRASNPNVYEDAIRIVKANHLDELIEEKLAARQAAAPQAKAKVAQYSESPMARPGVVASAPESKTKIRVTASKAAEVSAWAEEKGIPEEAAYRIFQKRGWLK